jgi:general stress protein 26
MDKQTVLSFLHSNEYCIVSTVDSHNKPEAALVGFSENDTFEIMIGTMEDTRKFKNISQNPAMAIVIGWDNLMTVQYEGTARIVEGDELKTYQANHFAKLPGAEKFKDLPGQKYIVVSPEWLRYTDFNKHTRTIKEYTF